MTSSPNKVILITDADSAVGEAAARHLTSLGHTLMLGARCSERAAALARSIVRTGGVATYQELDPGSPGSVRAFILIAEACFGRIDVLVNTAGMRAGIVAILPVITAQGMSRIIHVPTGHALQSGVIAEQIGCAIGQPADHASVGRPRMPMRQRAT
ncbi:hypothetical protein BH11PSE4_BH11PSE4_28360 [soil metagenome]